MPADKELNKRNDVARVFALLTLFFVSALVGVASGVGVTHVIKHFALVAPQNAETIAQASEGKVLGEKDFQIAQTAPFFDCAKEPYASSPACKGEHPRLHITQETIPYFREKIVTYYSAEYQSFVNWVDSQFNKDIEMGLMSDYHALVFLLGTLPGVTYPRDITAYGQRAIEIMLNEVAASPIGKMPRGAETEGKAHDYRDDVYSIVARSYDWMWHEMTSEQKATIAAWLADSGLNILNSKGIKDGDIDSLFSSSYFESYYPWYMGLALYSDGIRDETAQTLVDLFNTLMLNGKWLDAQNWVAQYSGGTSELGNYGLGHPLRHIINIDGWRTATGENYFAKGTGVAPADFVQSHPQFVLYRIKPYGKSNSSYPQGIEWKTIKVGQAGAGIGVGNSGVINVLGEPLKVVNPDMAGLNRWLIENRVSENPNFPYSTQGHAMLWFLFGDRTIAPKSPNELGLPTSQFFEGLGMAVMRTGFDSLNDTAILVLAPPYRLNGHDWDPWTLIPAGFTIDKYGPLAIKQMGYIRGDIGYSFRNNFIRFTDPLKVPDSGFGVGGSNPDIKDVRQYTPGSPWDLGGMKRRIFDSNYDYLYMDYTKYYDSARVSLYTRQFAYFKPDSNQESDYIVILDRTQTTRPDIIKRWALNMAYNPQINGQESLVREGKWEYTNADQIIISNNVSPDPYNTMVHGGHGRLFVKSLLPEQKKIVKVGGPGHEFEDDAGNWVGDLDMPYLKEAGAFYTGTYYTDVVALNQNTQENFLHVLQTADANLVSTATPTERIDGDTMVGAYIKDDAQGHKVVMFSRTEANQAQVAYSISASAPVEHLIADLAPFGTYDVYQDSKKIDTLPASEAGTLSFNSNGGGSFDITSNALPPTVVASAAPISGNAPLAVSFTAVATDLDGTIQSYNWSFGDNTPNSTQQNPSHTYSLNGTYQATVTVTDDSGLSATSIPITITVTLPPQVTASADVTSGQTPLTVNFTAIGQNIVSYLWNFGDSQTSTQQNPSHVYQNSGTYTATVTGTDSIGKTTTDSLVITVTGPLTTIAISPSQTTVKPGTTKQFIANGRDSDGNPVSVTPVWSVNGGGTIDGTGLFTAGNIEGGPFTLTASVGDVSGIAQITISSSRIRADLVALYDFNEGAGTVIRDVSDVGVPLDLTVSKETAISWVAGGLAINSPAVVSSVGAATKVIDASLATNEITVEAWIKPANVTQSSGYIIAIPDAKGSSELNFVFTPTLAKWRTSATSSRGDGPAIPNSGSTELSHVVGTYTAGIARVYVNGSEVVSKTIGGNLSNWATNSPLTLANNVTGAYPWQGEFHLVAIYNRALTSEEVSQNFDFGPGDQMPNQPPTVAIVANPTSGAAPLTVTFTPTAQDPDGTIATYAWDFGDSSTATEQNPTHTYSTPGTYTAKVTVTDNQGATAFANVVITVSDKPSPNLTLAKSADKTEVQSADTITYTITYKNDGTADAINVVITDPIPSGTVYVDKSATQGGAYNTNKNEIQWTIPTLAPNASGSVSFQAMVE